MKDKRTRPDKPDTGRKPDLAYLDDLTGLYNRRYLYRKIVTEKRRITRTGESLSMLLIDVDKFKDINDTYGHSAGDVVLKTISRQIKAALRMSDIPCRYGGDEFLIFMPNTDSDAAMILAKRLKDQFDSQLIKIDDSQEIKVTLSVGVAEYNRNERNVTRMLNSTAT